jgi:putative oxidoreductase
MQSDRALNFMSRALLATIFIGSGIDKLNNPKQTIDYMKAYHVPLASLALPVAAGVEILGGLSLLTGYKSRISASVLLGFIFPTTLIFHRFWSEPEDQKKIQQINFMKNHAIMGGLLQIATHGAEGFAIERALDFISHKRESKERKAA